MLLIRLPFTSQNPILAEKHDWMQCRWQFHMPENTSERETSSTLHSMMFLWYGDFPKLLDIHFMFYYKFIAFLYLIYNMNFVGKTYIENVQCSTPTILYSLSTTNALLSIIVLIFANLASAKILYWSIVLEWNLVLHWKYNYLSHWQHLYIITQSPLNIFFFFCEFAY